jgi:hypothetical protein
MIPHIVEFFVDYFTNLNIRKIIGGLLVLIGMWVIGMMGSSGNPNNAVLYAILGILLGGIGFVVIYYDMAKSTVGGGYDELDTLAKAYKQEEFRKNKVSGWHMNQESKEKGAAGNNKVQE